MSELPILCGDHAQFEIDNMGKPKEERPDWPYPSFDARHWAKAFCKLNPQMDEELMLAWFANALMRGYDQAREPQREPTTEVVVKRIIEEDGQDFAVLHVNELSRVLSRTAHQQQPALPQCNPPETCVTLADYNTMENERNYHMAMEQSLFERVTALESMLSLPQGVTKQNTARIELPGIRQMEEPSDSSGGTPASRTGLPNNCEGSAPTLSKEEAVEIILEAWEMRQKKLSPLTRWLAEDAYRALAKRLGWM